MGFRQRGCDKCEDRLLSGRGGYACQDHEKLLSRVQKPYSVMQPVDMGEGMTWWL